MADDMPTPTLLGRTTEPNDTPSNRAAAAAIKAFDEATADIEGARIFVLVSIPTDDNRVSACAAASGYEQEADDARMLADMFMHMRAIVRTHGKDLQIVALKGN